MCAKNLKNLAGVRNYICVLRFLSYFVKVWKVTKNLKKKPGPCNPDLGLIVFTSKCP